MPQVRSSGIILHRLPYAETSLILKVFTREAGLVSLIAKGAHRPKSKFQGLLDSFSVQEFIYYSKPQGGICTLGQASVTLDFEKIRTNLAKQALANVFLELYLRHIYGPEASVPHFELLEHNLEQVEHDNSKSGTYPLLFCDFLLSFTGLLGIRPQFVKCVHCGKAASPAGFPVMDLSMGGPACHHCRTQCVHYESFSPHTLPIWLHNIQMLGSRSGTLPPSQMARGEEILMAFLYHHSSRSGRLKSFPFYRRMISA